MPTVKSFHNSGRWDRSPDLLAKNVRRMRQGRSLGTRTELKNLNSFRFVEAALHAEIRRQAEILDGGGRVVQATLAFDPPSARVRVLRLKENADDYRYFPDPDLVPLVISEERIEAVQEMLVGSLRGNVQLECDIPSDIWPVEVDIAELELALVNIAVNARDAMPGGGIITLSARNVALKKSHGVDGLEGDFFALARTDTGVGIAPDVLPRIFEPFYTTKALGKGTGLGLAQVYGFSHQSGGGAGRWSCCLDARTAQGRPRGGAGPDGRRRTRGCDRAQPGAVRDFRRAWRPHA